MRSVANHQLVGPLLVAIVTAIALCAFAPPANAADRQEHPDVPRFDRRPTARLATTISEWYLRKGRPAKAMNWAERAAACGDATKATTARTHRLRNELRWQLTDKGYGIVNLHIAPAGADVEIDDQLMRPAREHYVIWMPAGTHHMRVRLADHGTVDRIISAARGEKRRVDIHLAVTRPPRIEPHIEPASAEIWIDSVRVGHGRSRAITTTEGSHLIQVRASGFVPWTRTVRLQLGDIVPLTVTLERHASERRAPRLASTVDRTLNRHELAAGGARHRVGVPSTRDPARVTVERPGGGGGVAPPNGNDRGEDAPERPSGGDAGGGGAPDGARPEPPEPDDRDLGSDSEDVPEPPAGGAADAGVTDGATAGSRATRGWLLGGGGLLVAAGGVVWTILNVADAQYANDLKPGHKSYADYYSTVKTQTYAGYGVVGAGVALAGVGGWYLMGAGGTSRAGKGLFLSLCGAVAAGTGGYLLLGSQAGLDAALQYGTNDPRRAAALDAVYASYDAGLYAAIGGGALAAVGLYVMMTGGSATSTAMVDDAGGPARSVQLTPTITSDLSGASLTLRW